MTVRMTLEEAKKSLTEKERRDMLDALMDENFVDEPDEDCPEYSYEELQKMREAAVKKLAEREKKLVTLNISRTAIENARRLGAVDAGALEKILEKALSDDNFVMNTLRSVG